MKVLLFGATGMIGQGLMRECLLDPDVTKLVTVGRRPTGQKHPKLSELVHPDLAALGALEPELAGFDACLFTLGVSALGMSEAEYTRLTYDLTMSVAKTLLRTSPELTFVYVSGAGTDSSEKSRMMWARVKGRTENALLSLPFKAAYMFRPGAVIPVHGVRSSVGWYNAAYVVLKPLSPMLSRIAPNSLTTTERLARAMIAVARNGYPTHVLEMADMNRLA
jgi:uncharacterized protein YbjT (DUF2867 family)